MPMQTILKQAITELATTFQLRDRHEVFLVPHIMWRNQNFPITVQVAEGGSRYESRDGSIRIEQFNLLVGLFRYSRIDNTELNTRALADLADAVHRLKDIAVSALDGNFLANLLTRPLLLQQESQVRDNPKYPGLLLKELIFVGGTNVIL